MSRVKTTEAERVWGIAKYDELCRLIDEGKWDYSKSKLKTDFEGFKAMTWWELHPVAMFFILIGGLLAGFIPLIFLMIAAFINKPARERYEVALGKLKHNRSFQTQGQVVATPTGSSSEVAKLHDLLKSGALTQEEFDSEKKKILGKAA